MVFGNLHSLFVRAIDWNWFFSQIGIRFVCYLRCFFLNTPVLVSAFIFGNSHTHIYIHRANERIKNGNRQIMFEHVYFLLAKHTK